MGSRLIDVSMKKFEVGIILPTYKEADNIGRLIEDIENLKLNVSILVIDDSSPDGTADIVREKQVKFPNVTLHVRSRKSGLGTAITDGFKIFLSARNPLQYVFTMDSDYSHNPQDIPQLLAVMQENDCGIVIGSRYIKGGKINGWPLTRKITSKTANFIARTAMGLKPHDCTSGFRCYSTKFLSATVDSLHSHTYEIQIETVRQASLMNFKVQESPVVFVNRKQGKSKLSLGEVKGYFSYTFRVIWHSYR
jgi:dolichol-phosphate mannosyltransferase